MVLVLLRGLVLFVVAIVLIVVVVSIVLMVRIVKFKATTLPRNNDRPFEKLQYDYFLRVSLCGYHQSISSKLLCS